MLCAVACCGASPAPCARWTSVTIPPVLAALLAVLDGLAGAGGGGPVPAGGSVSLPLALPHLLPATFAFWWRGEGVSGAGVCTLVSEGEVGGADGEILGIENHFDIVFVQPIRLTPGAPLAPPLPIFAPTLVLPNIPAFLKLTKRKCRKVKPLDMQSTFYLSKIHLK